MSKRILTIILSIVLLTIAVLLSACGNKEAVDDITDDINQTPAPIPVETPRRILEPDFGGLLTLTMRTPQTLNPLLNVDKTVDTVLTLLFEKLFIIDDNQKPRENPALVESYAVSADARSLTITMRNDINWSDGTPITANDVAYTIDFLRTSAPSNAIYKQNVNNVQGTNVTGNTIRINLTEPNAYMEYMLNIPIVPQAYYRGVAANNSRQMRPVGSGPYIFESYHRGREMYLTATPWPLRSPVYIENVIVLITDSHEQDINAISNRIADAAYVSDSGWGRIRNRAGARASEFVSRYFDFLGFNFNNPVLNNREVRAAIAHAIPYRQVLETVYLGEARLAPTPISPETWLHDDKVEHLEFDLDKGLARLENIDTDELILRILVNKESRERTRAAEILYTNLKIMGIETELLILPFDEYTSHLNRGEFDIFFGGYNLSPNPDLSFMFRGQNLMQYRDDMMNTFLNEARTAFDDDAMIQAYSNLQNYIAYELPIIGLVFRTSALLVSGRINGPLDSGGIFVNIEEWYIETK